MAKPTSPVFTHSALIGMDEVVVANPNRDGSGTLVTLVTGNAEGTRIDLIRAVAQVTTSAGMIRLFLYDGVDVRLWKEIPVTAITASATVPAFDAEYQPTEPLILPDETWELRASTEEAEAINVMAFGGHFG